MAGAVPPCPVVPLPRRSPETDDPLRHWYENELGWPVVPGEPVRLSVGPRFDVLDVPAQAGLAALRHLAPGSPVAVHGGRMRLWLAPGSAEELPGLLEWLEWGPLSPSLDLTALGAGTTVEAPAMPVPPAGGIPVPRPGGPQGAPGSQAAAWPLRPYGPPGPYEEGSPGEAAGGRPGGPLTDGPATDGPGGPLGGGPGRPAVYGPGLEGRAGCRPGPERPAWAGAAWAAGEGGFAASAAWAAEDERFAASQGAAMWLRPPGPGCEVESSLPTMSALGGRAGAPDLVRVVDTVATQCHRIRLRRACAQPLAFS